MRFIERQQRLRKLSERRYTTHLKELQLETWTGENHSANLSPGLNIIAGGNGAGKSTLLGAIWRCVAGPVSPEQALVPSAPPWLKKIQIEGEHSENSFHVELELDSNQANNTFTGNIEYIDPATETEDILGKFRRDAQPTDLLEGIDPTHFSRKQLEMLSYVLRRDYSELLVYEVTAFSEDDSPVPYFEVESMGKRYALPQMGRGELSASYLLWRLEALPTGSIVLIEEPESHLAFFSQNLLVDAIVAAAVDRDLCLIVSTHSPGFFGKLSSRNISLISSLPEPSLRCGLPVTTVSDHLGIRPNIAALVLVEDEVASELLQAVISSVDRETLKRLEICPVRSGESGVTKSVQDIQVRYASSIKIMGILDGDQRPNKDIPSKGPDMIGYLVGAHPPEELIRRAFLRWRSGDFPDWSPSVPGTPDEVRLCLERLDGLDLHDWFRAFANEFGGTRIIAHTATDLLLQDEEVRAEAIELTNWIREQGNISD
ncbi:AAA family ATPase [Actinomadura sp. KC345]|uniref:ATP-dependent nuclease n=1 Tax=Actinomadura sp. KC345 TaxID=2530371 RepID=UPI0014044911|nr:AAA family ATPase [Actinomadura sp. KC345]